MCTCLLSFVQAALVGCEFISIRAGGWAVGPTELLTSPHIESGRRFICDYENTMIFKLLPPGLPASIAAGFAASSIHRGRQLVSHSTLPKLRHHDISGEMGRKRPQRLVRWNTYGNGNVA
jgi:hypothetical protein